MSEIQSSIVIDNGSGTIKCGFSTEDTPKSTFPTLISPDLQIVGDESLPENKSPISHGVITNFDQMEKIWEHTFKNELRVQSDERNILLTDAPISPKINREKSTQIMFEKLNVQGLFISTQSLLSIYSVGKTTGLVLDSGDDVTDCVPIIEGYNFPYTITKYNLGGRQITDYLVKQLMKNEKFENTFENRKKINEIKERVAFFKTKEFMDEEDNKSNINNSNSNNENKDDVCMKDLSKKEDNKSEVDGNEKNNLDSKFKMPDGSEVNIKNDLFNGIESIFKPDIIGYEIPGVHLQIYNSIMKNESEIRKELYNNIILAGGNTLFMGFPERLTYEMQKIVPISIINKVKVVAQNERKYAAWIGGAILAGLSNFQFMWISHNEYQEAGPQIVHRKCL